MPLAPTLFASRSRTGFAACLAFVLGCALQLQQSALWHGGIYMVFVVLALVFYGVGAIKLRAERSPRWALVWVLLAGLALGLGSTGLRSVVFAQGALEPALQGRDVVVTGVVLNLPQRNEAGLRFRLAVESAQWGGQTVQVPSRIDVGWYGGVYPMGSERVGLQRQPGDVRAGERWRMTLRLRAPHGSSNPHGFDYELWLWEQGVQATGYVRAGPQDPVPQRLEQTWRQPVALARQAVRERIFAHEADRQRAGLLAALVVGDQGAIERADWDVFRATGVSHLVSISGLHITMFAWAAALLVGGLWRRSRRLCLAWPAPSAALVGGVLLAGAYALFSGWGVPAQRTCLMLATVVLLRLSGLRWPWPQVWMLACAVVVASDPWALLQPGFWLSFVAVGVLFASDPGAAPVAQAGRLAGAATRVAALFREQWVVTVALAPLTLLLFGQMSLVGLVANALAIPWVTLVLTPLALLGVLVGAAWDLAGAATGVLLAYLQWLAAYPWAALSVAQVPLWVGVAGVVGGVVLVFPWSWRLRVLGLPLLLPLLLWQPPLPAQGEFEVLAADVGQGNAVLVRTAAHALLFDTGPRYSVESDAGHRVLVPLMQALHTRLDRVVLSHRDTDHVGGAAAVLAMQPQAEVLASLEADHPLQALRPMQRCVAGQRWRWDGVDFELLHPLAQDYGAGHPPNAMSCTLRISNGLRSALLAGDIEQAQEARLVAQGARPGGPHAWQSDLLLVPHHGSKTSSSEAFLDAVQPQWALVQAGYRNRFGHPAAPVLARYAQRSIAVVDTAHCGAITWNSALPQEVRCQRVQALRYWHHRVP